jgi:hypothetical protein
MRRTDSRRTTLVMQCMLLVGLCASCRTPEKPQTSTQGSGAADSSAAAQTLLQFLAASVATSSVTVPDSLLACNPEYAASNGLVLVNYQILGIAIAGDSAVGEAQVVSVAHDMGDSIPGRTVRVVGVSRDTLQWRMIRGANGRWGVCGYAKGAIDFVQLWDDSTVIWRPRGESMGHLRTLMDSVRAGQD